MSAIRDEIVQYLNDYLQIGKFKDYCPNGMQVIGRPAVSRVALGVSANLECFRLASEQHGRTALEFDPIALVRRAQERAGGRDGSGDDRKQGQHKFDDIAAAAPIAS